MKNLRAVLASYIGVLAFASILFLAAGRLRYAPALLYVGVALAGTTLSHLLVPPGSDLTAERAARARAGEAWDHKLLGAMALANLLGFVVAGLDSGRFGWSGAFSTPLVAGGVFAMLAGQALFAWAKRVNAAFTATVRILDEREHAVCRTGPYAWVRHPGYLGLLASQLAFPLVLQSWWALLPSALAAGLLVARTVLEDRFLHARLPGYADYAREVRWRLVPGLG